MAKGPANQGVGGGGVGQYMPGGNTAYGATATMPSPALMPTPQNVAKYDVGGGNMSTVKPVLGAGGIPTITPEMRAAAAAPIPGTQASPVNPLMALLERLKSGPRAYGNSGGADRTGRSTSGGGFGRSSARSGGLY